MTYRIVSLLPAATEILYALGLRDAIVGRSHECDYPPGALDYPVCTRTRVFSETGDSASIHRDIVHLIEQALAIYEVDAERLKALRPTHILTQDMCSVCAVSPQDLTKALGDWLGEAPVLISLSPNTLEDIFCDILRMGEVFQKPFEAEDYVGACWKRIHRVLARGQDISPKPSVVCIEWTDPLLVAGHWVPELVQGSGGRALLATPGQRAVPISMHHLAEANPDIIVAMPCGFHLEQTHQAMQTLRTHPLWPTLNAVRNQQVYLTNGNQFFNRPGPRIVESLEILAEILHPQVFSFGHRGTGWRSFTKD